MSSAAVDIMAWPLLIRDWMKRFSVVEEERW